MRKLFVLIVVLLTACTAFATKDRALLKDGEPFYEYREGEVLVKLHATAAEVDVSALAAQVNGQVVRHSELLDFYTIKLNQGYHVIDAVKQLRALPEVKWANFNYILRSCFTPNDTFYPYQWHYPRINMEAAWDITMGSASVTVAVCDQGWQFDHEDYAGVQTVSPYDAIEDDNDPSADIDNSHGMHVAGTILAATNNNLGVAGIAPQCRLMPIRVLDDENGSGTADWIADGITWAGNHGADVLNLSFGIPVSGPPSDPGPPISTAVYQTSGNGTIIFAATGNDGEPYVGYPAAYDVCIAVGSTGLDDAIAPYSNYGSALDIVAPGGNLLQDLNNDGYTDGVLSTTRYEGSWVYTFFEGTSMASPHAAGIGALLLSNGLPSEQVRQALQETAVDLGSAGWDNTFGHGRIDAYAALQWQGSGGEEITLLEEGFEGAFPPTGWQIQQLGPQTDNWMLLAGNAEAGCGDHSHGGANAIFHNDDDGVSGADVRDMLICAPVSVPANAEELRLRFYQRNCWVEGYYTDSSAHLVMGSTDGTTFNMLTELDIAQNDWAEINMGITGGEGQQVWFAFFYQGDYATEWYIDDVRVTVRIPSATPRHSPVPETIALLEPYPNPFNSTTHIPLELPTASRVEISVYNILGQRVATLLPLSNLTAGVHRFTWNAQNAATGMYVITLQGEDILQTRRVLFVK